MGRMEKLEAHQKGLLHRAFSVFILNSKGEMLMTWVEDAGWGTPGTLVCQLFDENGKSLGEPIRKPELPAWSFGAPYADANGTFVVLY